MLSIYFGKRIQAAGVPNLMHIDWKKARFPAFFETPITF